MYVQNSCTLMGQIECFSAACVDIKLESHHFVISLRLDLDLPSRTLIANERNCFSFINNKVLCIMCIISAYAVSSFKGAKLSANEHPTHLEYAVYDCVNCFQHI